MKIEFEIVNYKKLQNLKGEFETGNLYFIQGPNSTGKSSFIQAILALIEGKSKNKEKLTHGKKEGKVQQKFIGADGEEYTIRMDYTEKSDKFTIIKPDASVSHKRTDMAHIFGYNSFTVDDWFSWGETAEGRRKQADIIKTLLPEETIKELNMIHAETNGTDGILLIKRRDINRDLDKLKARKENLPEIENVSDVNKAKETIEKWNKMLEEIDDEIIKKKSSNEKIITLLESKDNDEKNILETKHRLEDVIQSKNAIQQQLESEIQSLKEQLKNKEKQLENHITTSNKTIETYEQSIEQKQKAFNEKYKDVSADVTDYDTTELEEKKAKTKEAIAKMNEIINILEEKKKLNDEIDENQKIVDDLSKDITDKRERAKSLISNADIAVENIGITDEGEAVFVENDKEYPFKKENISYSKGGIAILQIMAAVNKKLPLWIVGNAAEYDNAAKDKMARFAKENGGIILGDRVIEDVSKDLEIVCYDNSDNNTDDENKDDQFKLNF